MSCSGEQSLKPRITFSSRFSGKICSAQCGKISGSQDEASQAARANRGSDYKTAMSSQTDALLQERGRIDSSHRMMDDTLK